MSAKLPYEPPKLISEKVFLPMLNATTAALGYGGFQRSPPPPK